METPIAQELEQIQEIYMMITTYLVTYSFQIIGAIIILIIGFLVGRRMGNWISALCERRNMDVTLSRFFASFTRITIVAVAFVIALPKLGIEITPFIAAIGAMGLAAGLAVQGLLSNYGAGLSIILARPFVVGDTIRVQGVWGVVKEVHLAFTELTNEDGEIIIVPNRHIVGEIIHNSQADTVVELTVGIEYVSDTEVAVAAIQKHLEKLAGVSDKRPVQVGIDNFGDSSIDIGVRCWVKTEQFHETRFACNRAIQLALQESGIGIPCPQREVRMLAD